MGELILPAARNDGAARIVKEIQRITPVLPANVDRGQFCNAVVVAANEVGNDCNPTSVLMAAYHCAQLGLLPGKALGLAYFVPFKGQCTLIPGYRGFLDLAYGNGFLKEIHCDVVYRGEEFRYFADENGPRLHHEIPLERSEQFKDILASYTIYKTTAGGRGIIVLDRKKIDRCAKNTEPWKYHYDEMAMKTTVRRAAKRWKVTKQMGYAITLDEQAERDERQDIGLNVPIDVTPTNGKPKPALPERESMFETFQRSIERGDYEDPDHIRQEIVDYTEREQLTPDEAAQLRKMLPKPAKQEAAETR